MATEQRGGVCKPDSRVRRHGVSGVSARTVVNIGYRVLPRLGILLGIMVDIYERNKSTTAGSRLVPSCRPCMRMPPWHFWHTVEPSKAIEAFLHVGSPS